MLLPALPAGHTDFQGMVGAAATVSGVVPESLPLRLRLSDRHLGVGMPGLAYENLHCERQAALRQRRAGVGVAGIGAKATNLAE